VVSREEFARVVRLLLDSGFRFTVIGGTVVELEVGSRNLGDDVDVFAESPSPVVEEDFYRMVAEENGWVYGQTWLGTPRIIVRVGDREVPVEFYDNIYDFYVPEEVLNSAVKVKVKGVSVKMIRVEDHIVLKANAGRGSDMERLKEIARLVKKGKLKISLERVRETASLFDDMKGILNRLRSAGFSV
jgi:predicted nucleotidyltransferase